MNKLDEIIENKRQEWLRNGYGATQLAKMVALEYADFCVEKILETIEIERCLHHYPKIEFINKKILLDSLNQEKK